MWVALFSWALLSLDRLTAKPPLLLRMGVVCALALLVGRVSMGVLVVPGGWLPVLCGCGAAWMVERE
ncbi:hypothetical protein H8D30_01030 [bacterium]|nr:hypothetical protein [bacterium]